MSESLNPEGARRNTGRLQTNTVFSLTRGWQQWVSENVEKQASEPSGWAPSSAAEPAGTGPTKKAAGPAGASAGPTRDTPGQPEGSRIKTKQVLKSVTSGVQEKSPGIAFLTDRYGREELEAVDRVLSSRGSPTRRRKCSNLVSELTKGWKEVEKEKRGLMGLRTCSVDTEDSGFSEMDERSPENDARSSNATQDQDTYPTVGDATEDSPYKLTQSSLRIKRPSTRIVNKDVGDARQMFSPVDNLKYKWQNWASDHSTSQKLNPFSEDFDYNLSMSTRLRKGQAGYGRPKEGTKTAERARRAEAHIHREIDDMCFIIRTMADPDGDGRTRVTFGQLFDRYVRISDKVVGILMRARKHGKVTFQGEMLWQGQDDHVVITLLV